MNAHAALGVRGGDSPYHKLDSDGQQIRLLVLKFAPNQSQPVCCELLVVRLDSASTPSYETISYVWGDPSDRDVVYVSGTAVSVPASATQVLRRFRRKETDRYLWIDAICINQNDLEERGHQVTLMAEIFSKTAYGLIWLGSDDGYALAGKTSIDAVIEDARQALIDLGRFRETVRDLETGMEQSASTPFTQRVDFDSLCRFYQSSWFERLWGEFPMGAHGA